MPRRYRHHTRTKPGPCTHPGCDELTRGRGLCMRHYQRDWARRNRQTPEARARRNARTMAKKDADPAFREKLNEDMRRWREANPGRVSGYRKWRGTLLMRQAFTCAICGELIADGETAHVDHIRPVSKGGTDEVANLQVTHPACNMRKGNRWDPDKEDNE